MSCLPKMSRLIKIRFAGEADVDHGRGVNPVVSRIPPAGADIAAGFPPDTPFLLRHVDRASHQYAHSRQKTLDRDRSNGKSFAPGCRVLRCGFDGVHGSVMTLSASPARDRVVRVRRPRHLSEAMRCETAFRLILSECLEEVAINHE